MTAEHSPLGRSTVYPDRYTPDLLFPIARQPKRDEIGVPAHLSFYGYDLWNAYEISWLNPKGKPEVRMAEILIPAESPYLIESKSLKLYLNSLNQTQFQSPLAVENTLIQDLSASAQRPVGVKLISLTDAPNSFDKLPGICIDDLDVTIEAYSPRPTIITIDSHNIVSESLHSHLLRSNCPITNQPDWGSIEITYTGPKLNRENILKYLISLRNHNEFHEQCVERIFITLLNQCHPAALTVQARYTRRGGLDINPYRSTHPAPYQNPRLVRQ